MGIKRLNNFLENKDVLKYHKNISDYIRSFKNDGYQKFNTRNDKFIIGVDLLLYAHKYKYSCNNIYDGFISQILNFLSNRIIPIYIIDGIAPDEKNDVIEYRVNRRNKINDKIEMIENKLLELEDNDENKEQIDQLSIDLEKLSKSNIKIHSYEIEKLINLFQIFNIPYIRAKNEADTLISRLYKENKINACLSEDMDLLVFGCKKMIKFKSNIIVEYDLDYITENLKLTYLNFVELCILFGCDYLKPLLRLKPNEIYKLYTSKKNVIDMFDNTSLDFSILSQYIDEFENVKELFLNRDKNDKIPEINFKINTIDINILNNFIKENNCNDINSNYTYQISLINELIRNKKFGI